MKKLLIVAVSACFSLAALCQSSPTIMKLEQLKIENGIEHSCVLVKEDMSFRWESTFLEAGHLRDVNKAKSRAYNGVLTGEQFQQLRTLLEKDSLKQLDNSNFHLPTGANGFVAGNHGFLEVLRGDHIQKIAFGAVAGFQSSGSKMTSAEIAAAALAAKGQEQSEKQVQPILHWIDNQIQKPHKKELQQSAVECATPELPRPI